ncbi:outer membrane protein assembly factor BamB family protein [Streptomyces reticuli]|uniref:outer membrane protein assembly factor BamB family protein n=1 Tax=Streptomyces reticuli TaxID=1926 RepID=UPI00073DE63E|nr:Outer membrane protein assembly factor BamB [Streptomyces reticuli]
MGDTVVQDGRPGTGRRGVRAGLAVVAAGAAAGLAVEFHILGWTSIPGGSCGGRYRPCPDGTTPTLILAFALTFVGWIALLLTIGKFTDRRPGKALPAVLAVAGVLLALWPGRQAYLWMRGPVLGLAWQAGPDRPSSVRAEGVWTVGAHGSTVVRVRGDALVAYDARDGDRRWTLRAPVRESVCGMSEGVADGVGLVAFARYEKPCDTVWGVDTRTGRKLWERTYPGVAGFTSGSDGLLAADGDTALALTDTGVRAYGLADGRPRWTADLRGKRAAGACAPNVVSAAGGTARVVVTCQAGEKGSGRVVTLDTATGERRGSRALPVESPVDTAMVVAAEPFTLLLEERYERGVAAVLAYPGDGDDGDPVRIPLSADDEDLVPRQTSGEGFTARPALRATVGGGTLVVATAEPGGYAADHVSAYSLRDGRRLWRAGVDGVAGLVSSGRDRVAVLGERGRLWTFDTADGDRIGEADGVMVGTNRLTERTQLLRTHDTWIVVNGQGTKEPPLYGLR